jgi:hypothetical protein
MIFRLENTDTTDGQGLRAFSATGRRLSLALALTVMLLWQVGPSSLPSFAVGGDIRLEQLEMKFYKHTYDKDTTSARLERLEKMIFGESRSGSEAERLKTLADSVPNLSEVSLSKSGSDADETAGSSSLSAAPSSSPATTRSKVSDGDDSALDMSEERTNTGRSFASPTSAGGASGSQGRDSGYASRQAARSQTGESQYPAVTAMEEQLFTKNFIGESVTQRLNRLEERVFGKPSKSDDLSARVDALKERTRIDVAKQRPPGSDWVEEDEEEEYSKYARSRAGQNVGRSDGDDGRSFSGRDLRQDMLKNFGKTGSTATFGGSGGYGMSGSSGTSSGAASGTYGMGGGSGYSNNGSRFATPGTGSQGAYGAYGNQAPSASPRSRGASTGDSGDAAEAAPASPVALSSQVASLEQVVLGQTGSGPLLDRVSHLEKAVLGDKAAQNAALPMPERIAKLLEKVPLASSQASRSRLAQGNKRRNSRSADDDDLDLDDLGSMGTMGNSSSMGLGGGMSGSMTQSGTRSSGLGKIMNGIGNLLGGGYSTGYYMPNTSYGRDPATGMFVDAAGNLISPSTGAIVGRSSSWGGMNSYTTLPQYGLNPYGGYGMSPPVYNNPLGNIYGNPGGTISPYGGYPGMNYGYSPYGGYSGGSGIRFGGGGLGIRFGY